jgi:hypothetical protein
MNRRNTIATGRSMSALCDYKTVDVISATASTASRRSWIVANSMWTPDGSGWNEVVSAATRVEFRRQEECMTAYSWIRDFESGSLETQGVCGGITRLAKRSEYQ